LVSGITEGWVLGIGPRGLGKSIGNGGLRVSKAGMLEGWEAGKPKMSEEGKRNNLSNR
jgi:hypothetical protein